MPGITLVRLLKGKRMQVFVTGGSGFVGRNLIAALCARGDHVKALARSSAAEQAVRTAGADPVRGDLGDSPVIVEAMRGCDVVFHAAATVKLWGDYNEFFQTNVTGTENVLRAAQEAGVPRFVHVSTEAVLAGGEPIVNVDEMASYPARPTGLYSLTKGIAEQRVIAANGPAMSTVAVRPPLIWGKGDTSVLPQIVAAVKSGQFMWIGGGRYPHTTTHVANVCEGLLLAADKGSGGEIYFLSDGPPKEFRWFLTELLATQGVNPGSRSIPRGAAYAIATISEFVWKGLRLKSDPPLMRSIVEVIGSEVTVNDAKARRELGYQGRMTHEQGFAEMRAAAPSA